MIKKSNGHFWPNDRLPYVLEPPTSPQLPVLIVLVSSAQTVISSCVNLAIPVLEALKRIISIALGQTHTLFVQCVRKFWFGYTIIANISNFCSDFECIEN